jgi:hypothetical protein
MESFMIEIALLMFTCLFLTLLAGILGAILLVEKRLGHASWYRTILALIVGVGWISLTIICMIGNLSTLERGSYLEDSILPGLRVLFLVLGILVSLLEGYAAGKVAGQNELVYGFFVGLGVVLFSIVFQFQLIFSFPPSTILDLAFRYALQIGATTLGGYIALFQRERNQAEFSSDGKARTVG